MIESQLYKLPNKVLCEIAKVCLENDYDFEDPYIIGYDQSLEIVEDASRWVGLGTIESIDIEFVAKFISLNENLLRSWIDGEKKFDEISSELVKPRPKKYMVYYSSKGRGYITQKYSTDWTSYDQDWIDESMQELNSIGDWSYYDGDYHGTEVDDFDENSLDVDEIEEVKEGYNESILNKLVVENTSEVINSLDKKTLLELRKLIDSKLRIL